MTLTEISDKMQKKKQEIEKFAEEEKCFLENVKKINYGIQLAFLKGKDKISVNIYEGKKGLSVVIMGKDSELKKSFTEQYIKIPNFNKSITTVSQENIPLQDISYSHKIVLGCDEAGKGDYFGSLVTAAVLLKPEMVEKIQSMGIKDSKTISDKKVRVLADKLRELCQDDCLVSVLEPLNYNQAYFTLREKGQNLNDLLASCHANLINELLVKQDKKCDLVIIDRFAEEKKILQRIEQKVLKKTSILQIVRGERNLAVAAASVLARAGFLESLEKLGSGLPFSLPKGAGTLVLEALEKLKNMQYAVNLEKLVKLHFKMKF